MQAQYSRIRAIAAACVLLFTTAVSHAALLNWTAVTWTAGTTTAGSNSYNVDGVAGNDITVAYTANNVNFNSVPSIATVDGTTALQFYANSLNTTGTVSVTITFTGTYAAGVTASFSLIDVDANLTTGGFQDKVAISALNGSTPVSLTVTNNAGAVNTISGSPGTTPSALGNTSTSTSTGNVNISTGTNAVTSITFTWSNPSTFTGAQLIGLGNITFTAVPVPEFASSSAALCLCIGMLPFKRRRVQRVEA
jgi:hypothetical protein